MRYSLIYITAANAQEAQRIGRELLEKRLVACVNILGFIRSLYWWKGAIQEDDEVGMIAKTQEAKVPQVVAAVQAMHSYTTPCVVALPISGGSPAFLAWLGKETSAPARRRRKTATAKRSRT